MQCVTLVTAKMQKSLYTAHARTREKTDYRYFYTFVFSGVAILFGFNRKRSFVVKQIEIYLLRGNFPVTLQP